MQERELDNLTEIIARRIYNENIIFYENAIYQGTYIDDFVLTINYDELKKAIKCDKDLTSFGMKNGISCIKTNLNDYLYKVKKFRESNIKSWIEMMDFANVDIHLYNYIRLFLETHTERENFYIKQAFLKKINYPITYEVEYEELDDIFYTQYSSLKLLDDGLKK